MRQQTRTRVLCSLIACSMGLAFCVTTLWLEYHMVSIIVPLGAVLTEFYFAAFFTFIGFCAGWLLYLLPVALIWQPEERWDNCWLTCPLAIVIACVLTHVETIPLSSSGDRYDTSMRVAYIFAGGVGGGAASLSLIRLLRRYFRMAVPPGQD